MSNNKINQLTKYVLEDFAELHTFDLSHNNFSQLGDNLFEFTPALSRLNISFNQLILIPTTAFEQTSNLTNLDVSHNQLISDMFLSNSLNELSILNLTHNRLTQLNVTLNSSLKVKVLVANNPWRCTWLAGIIPQINESRISFGEKFKIEHIKAFLNVSGIECHDLNGKQRSLIVVTDSRKLQTSLDTAKDNFTHSSTLLWLLIGIIVVFIFLKLMKLVLKNSENNTRRRVQNPMSEEEVGFNFSSLLRRLTNILLCL